jgi:very-short-patch-repair endonuclease
MRGQTNKTILTEKRQQVLRRNSTDTERSLWQALRGKQFNGYKFRRQHAYENFILDFVCVKAKLIIEEDGGQHADNEAHDQKRTIQLEQAGFTFLRSWNNQVLNEMESVKQTIWCALEKTHPHPNPPLEGEGTPLPE